MFRRADVVQISPHPDLKGLKARKDTFTWLSRNFATFPVQILSGAEVFRPRTPDGYRATVVRNGKKYVVEIAVRGDPPSFVCFNPARKEELKKALQTLKELVGPNESRKVIFDVLSQLDKVREKEKKEKKSGRGSKGKDKAGS